jgi:low affinity Fe/Cu permease
MAYGKKGADNGDELAQGALERFARNMAIATGRPAAFLLACAVVLIWAISGPLFGYSDSWQLVINTGTTIVTFLMVFLIQRAQNRDTMALQAKLAELIIAKRGAQNKVAMAENLSERELEALNEEHSEKAEEEIDRLEVEAASRPNGQKKAAQAP